MVLYKAINEEVLTRIKENGTLFNTVLKREEKRVGHIVTGMLGEQRIRWKRLKTVGDNRSIWRQHGLSVGRMPCDDENIQLSVRYTIFMFIKILINIKLYYLLVYLCLI